MRLILSLLAALGVGSGLQAGPVSFAEGWSERRLRLFSSNDYSFGETLGIVSEGSVSLALRPVSQDDWSARNASWDWTVAQSVPPTDLSRRGGDDRNISLYFLFVPEAQAAGLQGTSVRSLLGNADARVLQYVWGGAHPRGAVIASPYGRAGQGAMVALRQAGTGSARESVDLAADYAKAFGGTPGALIGLAVSADSDDTDSVIRAAIGNLVLR